MNNTDIVVLIEDPLLQQGAVWGNITGTLSNQTDLQTALNSKENALTFSVPLSRSANTISIAQATTSIDGFLSHIDWNTFNNKGSVTIVSVVTANGVSGSVANPTTTPAITLTLGAITPTTVNGLTFTANATGFSIAGGTTSKTLTLSDNSTLSGTNTGDQTITLTGDVAGSGIGSFAATIANGAVTYAKMQNTAAASVILGRGAGSGAGAIQELTLGSGLKFATTVISIDATVATLSGSQALTNKTIDASLNTISNLTTSMFATNVIDTDATLSANSDTRLATQKAIKSYVDNFTNGLQWKVAVKAATTANGTLSTAYANGQVVDGYTLVTGDRILIKNQTTQTDNGIYTVNASGSPTRSVDANTGANLINATIFAEQGTVNADTQWTCTNDSITIGATNIVFAQISGAGTYSAGTGLLLSGNQFSIDSTIVTLTGIQNLTNKTVNKLTFTTPATGSTLTILDGKTLTINKTLTLDGTDTTIMTFPAASDTLMGLATIQTVTAATTFNSAKLLATRPKFTTSIDDSNANQMLGFTAAASAVNYFTFTNAAASSDVSFSVAGSDTDINLDIKAKGAGKVKLGTALLSFPNVDGSSGQFLSTNGSGVLSWLGSTVSPSIYQNTVGPSGDYTTLGAAITAGKVRLLQIGNSTETGDITLPDQFILYSTSQANTITMAGNRFITTNGQTYLIENITFNWTNTTTGTELFTDTTFTCEFKRCIFDNDATSDNYHPFTGANSMISIYDCIAKGARQDFFQAIPNAGSGNPVIFISGLTCIGEGVNARVSIGTVNNSFAKVDGIYLYGTYQSTALRISGQVSNIYAGTLGVGVSVDSSSNVAIIHCGAFTISKNNSNASQIICSSLTLSGSASNCIITDMNCSGNITINSGSNNNLLKCAIFGGTLTDSATNNTIEVPEFLTTDIDGATVTFNMATSDYHQVTLAGNRTLAFSNTTPNQRFQIILIQDGTGTRTVTWPANIKWPNGVAPTLSVTAGKTDVFEFQCTTNSNYLNIFQTLGLS